MRAGPPGEGVGRAAMAAAYAGLVLHTLVYAAFLEDPLSWVLLALGAALRLAGEARAAGGPVAAGAGAGARARSRRRMSRVAAAAPGVRARRCRSCCSRRFSVSRRAVAIAGVVALIVLAIAIKRRHRRRAREARRPRQPSFNVLYDPAQLHRGGAARRAS